MALIKPRTPPGVLELLPLDQIAFQEMLDTIRAGDSLWSIAQRKKVSVADLRTWNKLGRTDVIAPGQTLVVEARR